MRHGRCRRVHCPRARAGRTRASRLRTVDLDPFLAAGDLLYDGPWLAERLAAIAPFLEQQPDAIHPITRAVILEAARYSAVDAFNAEYRRRELALRPPPRGLDVDAIALPSVPAIPTLADVAADPIGVNARLGRFSTFVNLLDLCAVAVPGGLLPSGLPIGFTLVAPACSDRFLLSLAHRYQQMVDRPLGAVGSGPSRRCDEWLTRSTRVAAGVGAARRRRRPSERATAQR